MSNDTVGASAPRYEPEVRWDVRVPVRDGLELSANLWLPRPLAEAPDERFGVVLEMIPYGKDNWRRNSDTARGEWLAARGFALCRLDVRGTGSSPGVALDEYTEAETHDGYDAVEWLAAQPWCNGNVGMWGISYGGFTSIQVARLRPPHLRAILPMYATDDRYRDDVHIRGGCVTASEKCQYAVSQLGMNAMPPHPPFRGVGWREEWLARLEATPPWLMAWIREQTDGPYWRRGSLAPDWDALECAVFSIAGWTDAYVDAAFRMQERCRNAVSVRTLVGNWVHSFPDDAYPGPNLDWLHELARFFDRYLKGIPNGWEREPGLVWFEHEFADPEPFPVTWPGRWRASATFPVTGTEARVLSLGPGTLGGAGGTDGPVAAGMDAIPHRATVGTSGALSWGAGASPNGLARDLRPDERRGETYTSEPLGEAFSIIGAPVAVLHLTATMPIATCVVRLSEVAPDGTSSLVATGVLNLTHRLSDTDPSPMPTRGLATEEVRIPLRTTGYRFSAGHRIRLTVLTSYWPVLWPSPLPGELRVHRGPAAPSRLELPVLTEGAPTLPVPAFRTEPVVMREVGSYAEDAPEWRIEEDVLRGTVAVTIFDGGGSTGEDGSRLYSSERLVLTASDPDPAHARLESDVVYRWSGFGAEADIQARGSITSDEAAFDVRVALDVTLDGEPFFSREWRERIPRNLV
ncbi:MAG TPA: CocE/NonD family hydrolase [Candidatus Limnocylindrales bacterium]|nr:CocE/NonD family hydrolase [Candidatus Limnocylindrales bacterium]